MPQWYGRAGHFVGRKNCLFHMHTHVGRVGKWCVSSVGAYYPIRGPGNLGERMPLDADGYLYETMVFALDDSGKPAGPEIEGERYMTRDEARAGHMRMCRRYSRR